MIFIKNMNNLFFRRNRANTSVPDWESSITRFHMQRARQKIRFGIAGLLLLFAVVIGESILKRSETHSTKEGEAPLAAECGQRKASFKSALPKQIPLSVWNLGSQENAVFFMRSDLVRPNVFEKSSFTKTIAEEKANRPYFFGSTDGPNFLRFIDIDGSTGGVVR